MILFPFVRFVIANFLWHLQLCLEPVLLVLQRHHPMDLEEQIWIPNPQRLMSRRHQSLVREPVLVQELVEELVLEPTFPNRRNLRCLQMLEQVVAQAQAVLLLRDLVLVNPSLQWLNCLKKMELVQVQVPMEWECPIHYSYRVRLVLVPVRWRVVHSRMYLMQLQFAVRPIDYLVCPRS